MGQLERLRGYQGTWWVSEGFLDLLRRKLPTTNRGGGGLGWGRGQEVYLH